MKKAKKKREIQFIKSVLHDVKDYELISPATMIQTFNLTKVYNITEGIEIRALNGVSIDIKKGEFVSVMGPSGSGKTTLLNNLVPVLSAYENVELPMLFAGRTKREIERNVNKFLDLVGLSEKKDHLPSELSGGEQQRVAIARALCNEPSILIADEPTGELDSKMGMEIIKLLRELNLELNQTILMVTHDPMVGALAERMLKMRDGKIIETVITNN